MDYSYIYTPEEARVALRGANPERFVEDGTLAHAVLPGGGQGYQAVPPPAAATGLSLSDAAIVLQIPYGTAWSYSHDGRLARVPDTGRRIRVTRESVDALLAERSAQPPRDAGAPSEVVSIVEAARRLGVSRGRVSQMMTSGALERVASTADKRRSYVGLESLAALIAERCEHLGGL